MGDAALLIERVVDPGAGLLASDKPVRSEEVDRRDRPRAVDLDDRLVR